MPCFFDTCMETGKSFVASAVKYTSTAFLAKGGSGAVWSISTTWSYIKKINEAEEDKSSDTHLGSRCCTNRESEKLCDVLMPIQLYFSESSSMANQNEPGRRSKIF